MKRVFSIVAKNGGSVGVKVTAEITASSAALSRHELEQSVTELADALMKAIPPVRYVGLPLSHLKVHLTSRG